MEQRTGSKLGKEYLKAVYCHLAYLTYMQSISREKAEEPEINSANICWIMEKARKFQKNIYFCFFGYAKAFDCVDHNKLWKILKETGIPDHLTGLLKICMHVKKQQLELDIE